MPHTVIKGHKTLLKQGSTTIAGRVTVTGPNFSRESIDTSNLDTEGGMTSRPADLYDNGEVSCTFQYDPNDTSHVALEGKKTTGNEEWSVVYPTDPVVTITFQGHVTGFEVSGMESGSNLTGDLKVKISGNVTKTTATPPEEEG